MDMIEKVARAAHDAQWEEPFPAEGSIAYAIAIQVARAAIEAMRETTAEMEIAGDRELVVNAPAVWEAMIDAALKPLPL